MQSDNIPWIEKHRPTSLDELVGNTDLIKSLRIWIESWGNNFSKKQAALLIGPPGVGKTASIGALANDIDAELVEFNASDKRNKGIIETQVWRAATQQTLDGRLRIILLDGVDGLSGTSDRGGISAILKVINSTVHPIVMIANNPDHPRLRDLVKKCRVFNFQTIKPKDMWTVLRRIVSCQSADIQDETLNEIIDLSEGDLRAAIADLEVVIVGEVSIDELGLSSRDVKRNINEVLRRLFMTTDAIAAKRVVSDADVDYNQLFLWLEENIHHNLTTVIELANGLEALALADLSLGRIMRNQSWKLLSYVYDFMSAGVATSRVETPFRRVEYNEPSWALLVWQGNIRRNKKSDVLTSIAALTGVSKRRVIWTHYNVIKEIIKKNPSKKSDFVNWLSIKTSSFS